MATTRSEKPEKRLRKKKKQPKKFRLSYSLILLFAMIVVGSVAGMVAYRFGKQALEGVNPSPAGIKLPKASPAAKPKETPKSSSQVQDKISFLLDESEVIADIKTRSQEELGGLRRPTYVAKANVSDRKRIYTKVDRVYNSMRDPLAISSNADDRIAERIAALRQRVYSRSYESKADRVAANSNGGNTSLPLLSTPVELTPIRSRWEDRDAALLNNSKAVDARELNAPSSTRSFFITDPEPISDAQNRR
ncbi:hypothetical protein H6F42_07060 [Pseudanabaena sp. FACHB-1998]|uniref:hypothetical protein n=1 Tax=Pseudanabaena sp. FACHB-1998 TaxID=2692858 RepID=UPI0016800EBE|nr:hypothetical protein [Pseudanabaena sp. FACHB-1998]MBD2176674.1 hypothetical protein [Pseudanabaena sp. FACHB-1998]